ncbi:MAG: 16S rRNA (adenine(1518)-N(6)/adenine(1519)-N(6))-dimethyltransferase RsmA [Clostridia bacterium]|nr:16S rRNA (adenine(1518)-N(6)/adenine(1519)-N(6))-dimethyltransferase RsmA [Clostridia bacterium]MDE7328347.1 16S rRNA (adenine(1518)-N(6)/adenine(1519)-N(6))-dimethyltransferase RsmA [Clostridia bacterium]
MESNKIKEILQDNNFRFNKQFGQNFITDVNLLKAMVKDGGVESDDVVVEIGAGAGTLTRELAAVAAKTYSFEIDRNLAPILGQTLQGLDEKVEVIFKDIQKVDDKELDEILGGKKYKVVANLPYYITTPIIMRFLERENKPESITVMIQKEVGKRLTSTATDGDYGVITLSIALEGKARIMREVPRYMFTPQPNVDSCIVRIDLDDTYADVDKKRVKKVIRAAFAMRRKTLVNNLMSKLGISRVQAEEALSSLGIDLKARGETLNVEEYIRLAEKLTV